MRKHFKLPFLEWNRVQTDFAQLLAKESRPISCYEVLNDRLVTGLTNVPPDELAYILRKDSQFLDMGFLIFALARWARDPEFRREMSRRGRLWMGRRRVSQRSLTRAHESKPTYQRWKAGSSGTKKRSFVPTPVPESLSTSAGL
jgi:hypothetical protein